MNCIFRVLFPFLLAPSFVYSQAFYDPAQIQKIEIQFSQNNWDYQLDTAKLGKDGYVKADWVKINGSKLDEVGVKYKGNSSYDPTFDKNPLHIELNTYRDQHYKGFVDLKLGNSYADPSMVREVMAYSILSNYMDCPQSNFAQVYINGIYKGVYSNVESVNNTFCRNHFYSDKGVFVKCNPLLLPAANVKSNLKHISPGDSSSYYNYYEMKSLYGWKNLETLCDFVTNNSANMSGIIDVDRVIWMLAFNTLLVNLDSYNGAFSQNYYLYQDQHQRFLPVLWDLNMSFGGFPFLGNSNTSLASLSIANMQNLPLNSHANDPYWPLIKAVFADPTLKKMYVAHLKTMLEEYFANNLYITNYQNYYSLIDTAVAQDTNMFFSYNQFQNALNTNYSVGTYSVPGIQTLMGARVSYLQSTADFALATPTIVSVSPLQSPVLNSNITLTAQVNNANQNALTLAYRYTSADHFLKTQLFDDGLHQDGAAGDQVFAVSIPFTANQLQYYLYAENNSAGIFSPRRAEHEFYEIRLFPHPQKGEVVINEFLADNKSDVRNEFNILADWIEIYNNSNNTLSMSNYYLSDENDQRNTFAFPVNCTIAPHGFLQVWADEVLQQGNELHANFNLNKNGDRLILSNGLNFILDSLSFGEQNNDVSKGRCPDGLGNFDLLKYPSYGLPNCVVGLEELIALDPNLLVFPNPAKERVYMKTSMAGRQSLKIYNCIGQMVYGDNFEKNITIETGNWTNGIYLVTLGSVTRKLIINN